MGMVSTAAIAVAVFTLPGFIVSWLSGIRGQWAAAAALPVSFGLYGLAAWLLGLTEFRFDLWSVALVVAGAGVLAVLWRLAFWAYRRRAAKKTPAVESAEAGIDKPASCWRAGTVLDPVWIIPGVGMAGGFAMIVNLALDTLGRAAGGMNSIFQGWDVHWHANVVRHAIDTGVVSPTRMGELQNTETLAKMYYPTAWHAGAAVFAEIANISPIAATNLTGLIVPALALPISVGLLAWRMMGRRGLTAQLAAGFAPLIVGGFPVLFWIGHYVGAWPYLAAVAVSGIVIAMFMSVPYSPIRCFATALAFIGMVQMHPSAATIVVLALAFWWLLYLLWVPAITPSSWAGRFGWRLRDVGILAATGLVGVVALLPQILIGAEQSEEVKAFTATEELSLTQAWEAAIYMQTRHTGPFDLEMEPWVWLAAAGGVVMILWRRNLWAPLFWLASVALTVNALRPFNNDWGEWLSAVGALHYNTAHRLIMPAALFVAAGAAVAIAAGIRLLTGGPIKKFKTVPAVLAVVVAAGGAWYIQDLVRSDIHKGAVWAVNSARDQRLVNDKDLKSYDWLAKQPKAYEGTIFSNPDEGSGWMYAYNSLPAFYKHYLWPTAPIDSATNRIFWHPMRLGQGNFDQPNEANAVDQAIKEVDVKYIIISPPNFWGFQLPRPDFEFGLYDTPGVTPVYKDGHITIYAVNSQFTDAEIVHMRAPGNSPEELPPLRTKAQAGKANSYEELNEPYIHRPSIPFRGRDSHFEWLEEQNKMKKVGTEGVKTGDSVAAELQEEELNQP